MQHIPNLKYKTTMCNSWALGIPCDKGYGCYFAHGQTELHSIQQNRVAISARNQSSLQQQSLENYKTIFCKFYVKGECKLGAACTFAHERREKKIRKPNMEDQNSCIPYENYYNMMAYYSQMNPWNNQYPYYNVPADNDELMQNISKEIPSEKMKDSAQTNCQQAQVDSNEKTSAMRGKLLEMQEKPESQWIEQSNEIMLNDEK